MKEFENLFERFKFYHEIHLKADVVKIGNLANKEKIISILKIIKGGGIDFIKNKVNGSSDSKMISSLLVILAPYAHDYCVRRYDELVLAKDDYILALEPYGSLNMKSPEFQNKNKQYYSELINHK